MSKIEVTIGIPTYNDFSLVNSLLTTIRYYTKFDMSKVGIVVCDDGSREEYKLGLRHIITQHKSWHPETHLIEHFDNQGIASSWNHLWKHFPESKYTILLNNDLLVTQYWLTSLVYFLENNPDCGACSLPAWYIRPVLVEALTAYQDEFQVEIVDPITRKPQKCQPHNFQDRTDGVPGRVMAPMGACFGTLTKRLREVGGFDEGKFKSFYEEIDYGTECAFRGYTSYALPYPSIYHIWSYTFAHNPELKASETMARSRANYIAKWHGDIDAGSCLNTHYRFMRKVTPNLVQWLTFNPDTKQLEQHEYRETWEDVKKSANEEVFFKLLAEQGRKFEEIDALGKNDGERIVEEDI